MKNRVAGSKTIGSAFSTVRKTVGGAGKTALAGATAAAMTAGGVAHSLRDRAAQFGENRFSDIKKQQEVVTMKKSTLVALLVALAAVAGVLGALYVYVLRREKELDEYEQLLFSEDFSDDIPDDLMDDEKD